MKWHKRCIGQQCRCAPLLPVNLNVDPKSICFGPSPQKGPAYEPKCIQAARQGARFTIMDMPEEFRQVCKILGMELAVELARQMGGTHFYVPRLASLLREAKYQAIRNEFTGKNYRELARKYGYTVQRIKDIVTGQTKQPPRKVKPPKKALDPNGSKMRRRK